MSVEVNSSLVNSLQYFLPIKLTPKLYRIKCTVDEVYLNIFVWMLYAYDGKFVQITKDSNSIRIELVDTPNISYSLIYYCRRIAESGFMFTLKAQKLAVAGKDLSQVLEACELL